MGATGRLGEEQLKVFQEQSERMAKAVKEQWSVFRDVWKRRARRLTVPWKRRGMS